jgi:hypothetical protein
MKFTYDGTEYDASKLTFPEAAAFEKVTGLGFQEAGSSKSIAVVQALVWIGIKRKQPELKFSEVTMPIEDIEFVEDEAEPDPTQVEGSDSTI